jgi:hypothetical protein
MTEILICGQCDKVITEAYIEQDTWAQCFDCYCIEQEHYEDFDDDHSYEEE